MPIIRVQRPAVIHPVLYQVQLPDDALIGCDPECVLDYLHPDPGVIEVGQLRHPQVSDLETAGVIAAYGALGSPPVGEHAIKK